MTFPQSAERTLHGQHRCYFEHGPQSPFSSNRVRIQTWELIGYTAAKSLSENIEILNMKVKENEIIPVFHVFIKPDVMQDVFG
jgi:hypothetical protein